jgi:hypothetical protein
MQTQVTAAAPRYLLLSPAGMAVALAALAFLQGLFAWPFLLLKHRGMGMARGGMQGQLPGQGPGQLPGQNPGQTPGQWHDHMYGGHMYGHGLMLMPWALPALWLASIVAAAIAGAIFAFVYNAVTARLDRNKTAAPAT